MVSASTMRASGRLVASLLTVAMLLAGPLGVPRSCSECPPGCPMHAEDAPRAPEQAKKQPGCHRTTEPLPAGTVCLRSSCGHDVTTESAFATLALLTAPARMPFPAPGLRLPAPPAVVASLDAPEPPSRPPRSARG